METRCSSTVIAEIFKISMFNQSIVSEAVGFSGGIWILWDSRCLQLESLAIHAQIVTVLICQARNVIWVLSAIYASPNAYFRDEL